MPSGGATTGHSRLSCQASTADDGCPGRNATDERYAKWNGYVGAWFGDSRAIALAFCFKALLEVKLGQKVLTH